MPKKAKEKAKPAASKAEPIEVIQEPAEEAAATTEEEVAASPAAAADAPAAAAGGGATPADGGDGAAAAAAAAAPPAGPPPHPGDVIWHRWSKALLWPAYVLEAAELPESMRSTHLDAATGDLPADTVALYYYGTHNYFTQKRSVLSKRWKAADKLPAPHGDPEADPNLKKALAAHELQLRHNEVLQLDFEYDEERAAEREHAEAAGGANDEEMWYQPKDPKMPKRPLNAYMVFSAEMRTKPKYKGTGGFGEHIQEIAKAWGVLPATKKAKYQILVDASYVKYNNLMASKY